MAKGESPKEWHQGDLTEEELARIMQPIGGAPAPEAPVEVVPEPEVIIEGEPATAEEPPLVIDIEDEPQAMPAQPEQAVQPAPVEVPPAPTPTPENNEHEQLIKAILQLLRGVYRARYGGQEPDEKYLNRMREIYASQTDERLRQSVEDLTREGASLRAA